MDREHFFAGEKLCFRWRGPHRILKAFHGIASQVEDLRNSSIANVHGSRLKLYSDSSLEARVIMSHVVSSEIGMAFPAFDALKIKNNESCHKMSSW